MGTIKLAVDVRGMGSLGDALTLQLWTQTDLGFKAGLHQLCDVGGDSAPK